MPLTVRLKAASPAVLEVGEIDDVVGTGLFIVKVWALDKPPPGVGLNTLISTVVAIARSETDIEAVS